MKKKYQTQTLRLLDKLELNSCVDDTVGPISETKAINATPHPFSRL